MTTFVTLGDGCRLAYRLDGPADAPVLLLSNSLGTTADMWAPQIDEFASRFRVLRYDSRGHGRSDVTPGAYSMDRLGRDVVELLDLLHIPQVSYVGLSKGGMVGQWLGARAPERLNRLVLCNTAAYMGPPAGWDARIAVALSKGMGGLTDVVIERWFTPEFRARAPEAIAPVRQMLLGTSPVGYAGCCGAIRDMDQRLTAPLIKVPTLVIGGSRDPATPPKDAEWLAATIPGAKLVMLDAAHLSNVEQPALFTRAVLSFLS